MAHPATSDDALAPIELERKVCEHIACREDELVELLRTLIGFDTVTFEPGALPREEEALQRFLGDRLAARGAAVSIEEPEAALIAAHPMARRTSPSPEGRSSSPGSPARAMDPRSC